MARFDDFHFEDDAEDVDTDPTLDNEDLYDKDEDEGVLEDEPVDATNYDEPGAGDSFRGEDPSVWDGSGDANRPAEQPDQSRGMVETSEQSATVPNRGDTFGRYDDPDAAENPGDEQTGDNEVDVPRPEEIRPKTEEDIETRDRFDEVNFETLLDEIIDALPDDFFDEAVSEMLDLIDDLDVPLFNDEQEDLYEDEYNMPDLITIMGTMELNDYVGDLELEDSKIIEFQDIDSEIVDLGDF